MVRPVRSFKADRGDEGERLDKVLLRHLADIEEASRNRIQEWIDEGGVTIRGEIAIKASGKVRHGDVIEVVVPPPPPPKPELVAQDIPLRIIHEDGYLMVIDKPPGLVVHPAVGHRDGTLVNALLFLSREWGGDEDRPGIVHRLDKDTSGLLLAAKTEAAHTGLGRLIRAHAIQKEYLTVVYGRPPVTKGHVDLSIQRDPRDRKRMQATKEGGRVAKTLYEVLSESVGTKAGLSLLRCRLVTGRTHQIRVHMKALGLPIVGDATYGAPRWKGLSDADLSVVCRDFPRQALHAHVLAFEHPVTKEQCRFEAPVPEDMSRLMAVAGLRL